MHRRGIRSTSELRSLLVPQSREACLPYQAVRHRSTKKSPRRPPKDSIELLTSSIIGASSRPDGHAGWTQPRTKGGNDLALVDAILTQSMSSMSETSGFVGGSDASEDPGIYSVDDIFGVATTWPKVIQLGTLVQSRRCVSASSSQSLL